MSVIMAESIRQPDELVLAGNIAEYWRKFKQEFELYLVATGLDTKTSRQKIALLLHVARKQAIEVYNTFSFTEKEDGDFDSVIEKFNSYCNPKKNETYERYVFHSRKQLQGEPIEQFVTDLKLKAHTCQFENLKDSMIRDRLVLGVTNTRVQERLLREENLNLEKAVKICQAAEATERQIQTLSTEKGASSSDVNYCQTLDVANTENHNRRMPQNANLVIRCTHHALAQLLIRPVTFAKKIGHFAVVCRTKTKPQRGKVRYVGHDDRQDDSSSAAGTADGMFIGMVNKADVGADKK